MRFIPIETHVTSYIAKGTNKNVHVKKSIKKRLSLFLMCICIKIEWEKYFKSYKKEPLKSVVVSK